MKASAKIEGRGWGVAVIAHISGCRMGRVKLKIKKLENTSNRQVTYSKRRSGILKKAKELSILCDIDIVLLMFSPTGRPTLFHGQRSNIEEVIAKFDQLTPQERAKRKLESLEALKKTFKKLDHDVNIQDFMGGSNQSVEELTNQVQLLQSQLTEVHKRLSYWSSPDKIDNLEHLRQMEDSIRESMSRIRLHKENCERQQLMSLECIGQFQNGMGLPLILSDVQEAQPLSWLPNNDNQHMMLHTHPAFLPHRGQEGIPGYTGQEGIALTKMNTSSCLSLPTGDPYPYSHDKADMEMNLQANPVDYQVGGTIYDHQLFSTSPQNGIALFHNNSYHQHQN